MNLATLRAARAELSLEFEGETLRFTIAPNTITPAYRAQLRQRIADKEAAGSSTDALIGEAIVQNVADLVTGWDLKEGDEPIPVSREAIESLPEDLVAEIWQVIDRFLSKRTATEPSA